MLSFCYHKRLSGYSPGNRFSILFVIIFRTFIYFQATEKPRKPYGSGVSYVWTQCTLRYSIYIIKMLCYNYSITVATRPDPTVRPPSRYQTGVLRCANGDFSCDLCRKIRIFRCVRVVFGDFVIMVLSYFLIPHLIISLFFTHKNSI